MAKRPVHPESAEPAGEGGHEPDRRRSALLIVGLVATVLLVWFGVANLGRVKINFWIYDRSAPLIFVIVISGLLGALITALVMRRKPKEKAGS